MHDQGVCKETGECGSVVGVLLAPRPSPVIWCIGDVSYLANPVI